MKTAICYLSCHHKVVQVMAEAGGAKGSGTKTLRQIAREKGCPVHGSPGVRAI